MTQNNESGGQRIHGSKPGQVLRGWLLVAAAAVVVLGIVMAAMSASLHAQPQPQDGLLALASVMAGIFLAAMLGAAAWIVGTIGAMHSQMPGGASDDVRPALERLEQSLRMLNSLQGKADGARAVVENSATLNVVGQGRHPAAVDELRDLMLMDDVQRKNFAQRHWSHRKLAHLEAIEREVLVGDWPAAFSRLEELQIVLPGDDQVLEMQERVESEQTARLEEDVRATRGRLRPLMTQAHWPQAEELADSLHRKYQGKEEAVRVVEDVRREREAWDRENSDRLFRDISAATDRRQWRGAILALDEFVRRYPLDPRAEALRLDLPMLQENAAAHERKEQEELFKDHFKHRRFEEAMSVGRMVVQKYPNSPTAVELNKMLPRVQELAKQEAARLAAQQQNGTPVAATAV